MEKDGPLVVAGRRRWLESSWRLSPVELPAGEGDDSLRSLRPQGGWAVI